MTQVKDLTTESLTTERMLDLIRRLPSVVRF